MSRKGTTRRRCSVCGRTVKKYRCSAGHPAARSGGWEYTVDIGPEGGPRDRRSKGGFTTQQEAQKQMDEIKAQAIAGHLVAKIRVTVGDYLREWAAGVDVRPSTRRSYEGLLRLHAIPRIGDVPLQTLTRETIKRVYGELTDEGKLSPSSIHRVHSALHRALQDAVEDRLLSRNPADEAHSAPKAADKDEMRFWTDGQARDFLAHAGGDRLFALWRLALFTGARRGELIGLRWDDVDIATGMMTFSRQWSRQGGKVGEGPTRPGGRVARSTSTRPRSPR